MEMVQEVFRDIAESIVYERKRGDCYRLLAACFYMPKKEVFIGEGLCKTLEGLMHDVCPSAAVHAASMQKALEDSSNEELATEYARLFVGPFELKAPPYGSVYMDADRRVMGESTMAVTNLYREAGIDISDDFNELPDHIAVELEFMYYLIFREAEALEKSEKDTALRYLTMQENFKNGFLGKWVALFCGKIKDEAENNFYASLSDCLSAFVAMDAPAAIN